MATPPLPHRKGNNRETVSSSSDSLSGVNPSGNVIPPSHHRRSLVNASRPSSVSSPVVTSPLMNANLDRGGNPRIKIEDYNNRYEGDEEEQCDDDADEDGDYDDLHADDVSRNVKVKTGRLRKREPRGFTKRWSVFGK